jgi:hypothetical protein
MSTEQMLQKLARLEFINDQLGAELAELDHLLRSAGFPEGVESVKQVAQEMLEEGLQE